MMHAHLPGRTIRGYLSAILMLAWAAAGAAAATATATSPADKQPGDELLVNGSFQQLDQAGRAVGWRWYDGAAVRKQAGKTWAELTGYGAVGQDVKLQQDWLKLKVSFRMRITGVQRGDDGWKNARMAMQWQDAAGKHVDPWPNVLWAEGTTDWRTYERVFAVPPGAAVLNITPAFFGKPGGKAEYGDVSVTLYRTRSATPADLPAPKGYENAWDLADAWRQRSPTRESICLNGLWQFLPVPASEVRSEAVRPSDRNALTGTLQTPPASAAGWGWFKVPGVWPRAAEGEAQELLLSPWMEDRADLAKLDQAWYRRRIATPAEWKGRRVAVDFAMLQTHARVFVDGVAAGELFFPGGQVDITKLIRPGTEQMLAILVTARPLEAEATAFAAPERVLQSKASIVHRGLTGDVSLVAGPAGESLDDVRIVTSTRKQTITVDVRIDAPGAGPRRLRAAAMEGGKVVREFASGPFDADKLAANGGRFAFTAAWPDAKIWDTHTPGNLYDLVVTLEDFGIAAGPAAAPAPGAAGAPAAPLPSPVIDQTLPIRFGFREFWIDGRDFYLNGTRIHLRSLFVRNITEHADLARTEACRTTCRRMKEYGFNHFITSNYDFQPGAVSYMDGLFDAADSAGVLASFSLPHFKDFAYKLDQPAQAERYRQLCRWLIARARNHPSIVLYAMSHNACGYNGDQNPLRIDGIFDPEDPAVGGAPNRNRQQGRLAAGIAKGLDPTRPVYHHEAGNLGDIYTLNCYLNWAPMQERSDWTEHWATQGVKPLFFVEWGLPHVSSWSSHRGPSFIWTTPEFQSIWDAEYNAEYLGDAAYKLTPERIKSRELEEELWAAGKPFYWSNLIRYFRSDEETHLVVTAMFANDNWRSMRTWGVSAMLPWDQETLWKPKPTYQGGQVAAKYQPADLKRPGIVPDTLKGSDDYLYALDPNQIAPTVLGKSFSRWNQPLCGFIAGGAGPNDFTDKAHNFLPGETIRKQLVILNDTREAATCTYRWKLARPADYRGDVGKFAGHAGEVGQAAIPAGGQMRIPLAIELPDGAEWGYVLHTSFDFGPAGKQEDELALFVLPKPKPVTSRWRIALFDPKGMTAKLLDSLPVKYDKIDADADMTAYRILILGREAIGLDTRLPSVARVREGLKVLVFEQTADVLSRRLGFRVQEHGLRRVFGWCRTGDQYNLTAQQLHDWRGSATLVPPYLPIEGAEKTDPKWRWCGFENTRVWRCGNRGCVASVLIETPPIGDFFPMLHGGFDLQYAPLLEYREGEGRVVFCQLDVTGRTEDDPAAQAVCRGLLEALDAPRGREPRLVLYDGDERGSQLLDRLGILCRPYSATNKPGEPRGRLVVLGPGAPQIAKSEPNTSTVALGLGRKDLGQWLGEKGKITTTAVYGDPGMPGCMWIYPGVSKADVSWRTRLTVDALGEPNRPVFFDYCGKGFAFQVAPWMLDYEKKPYLRTSYRRNAFLVSRLLHNLGASAKTPLLERLPRPAGVNELVLTTGWVGLVDKQGVGRKGEWWRPEFDDSKWRAMKVPGYFEDQIPELADYDGLFWYRLRFKLPAGMTREKLALALGPVDDESWVWLNGKFLGELTKQTNPKDYWNFPRKYAIAPGMLNETGENVLVVLVNDIYQKGGITGTPALVAPGAWLNGLYLDEPVAGDDPYRYYRW